MEKVSHSEAGRKEERERFGLRTLTLLKNGNCARGGRLDDDVYSDDYGGYDGDDLFNSTKISPMRGRRAAHYTRSYLLT